MGHQKKRSNQERYVSFIIFGSCQFRIVIVQIPEGNFDLFIGVTQIMVSLVTIIFWKCLVSPLYGI